MNLKSLIAGATVVSTTALVVAELIRDQREIQREKTEMLADQVAHFARKESIGDALKKTAKPSIAGDTMMNPYQTLAESEEYRKEMAEKHKNRDQTREHAANDD